MEGLIFFSQTGTIADINIAATHAESHAPMIANETVKVLY